MIESILAGLLVLAIAGWAGSIVLFARSVLPLANAFKVMHEVDKRFDERINAVLDRVRANTKRPTVPVPERPAQPQTNPLAEIFGPGPLLVPDSDGFGEQPDGLEVVQG